MASLGASVGRRVVPRFNNGRDRRDRVQGTDIVADQISGFVVELAKLLGNKTAGAQRWAMCESQRSAAGTFFRRWPQQRGGQ